MAEIPTESGDENTERLTFEIEGDKENQRELARKSIIHMQSYILSQINSLEKIHSSDKEKQSLKESINQIQEQFIEWSAQENPIIKTVWQEVNQQYEGQPEPSKELSEQLQIAQERVDTLRKELEQKYPEYAPEIENINTETEYHSELNPEQLRDAAKIFLIHMQKDFTEQIKALDDRPEEKALFIDSMAEQMQALIDEHLKVNPVTAEVWEEMNANVISIAETQISKQMTPDTKHYLEKRKKKRDSFLRIRETVSKHLDKEGLRLFDEAIKKEMDSENS